MTRIKGPVLTAERLREIVHYSPETGLLTWLISPTLSVKVGDVACTGKPGSYQALQFQHRLYKAHRLAWLYMTGAWPVLSVDHKNRIRDDNRWDNLREATRVQQRANQLVTSPTGYKGVCFVPGKARPYRVVIYLADGKRRHLGYFATVEAAANAYAAAAIERHGEFVCLAA